jgi:hypothetical protein
MQCLHLQKQAELSSHLYCFILIDPEDEGTVILQNTEVNVFNDAVLLPS